LLSETIELLTVKNITEADRIIDKVLLIGCGYMGSLLIDGIEATDENVVHQGHVTCRADVVLIWTFSTL